MEDEKNLNWSLKSLTLQDLNLDDKASPDYPDSSYPPVMIPLSAPGLKRHANPSKLLPKSAPVNSEDVNNGDVFFGLNDDDEEKWEMSYHQRRHSRYPNAAVTEEVASIGDNSPSGSLVTAMSVSSNKKVTNPWKSPKCRSAPSSLWKKSSYSHMVTSPLVPKVIPVTERVEMIIQEFAPSLTEFLNTSKLYEIKAKIKNVMIKGIKLRAIKKLLQTRADGKQLLHKALTAVTTEIFENGTEVQSYDVEGIETFIGNMAFIGYMARLNIVDESSTLSALSHLCRQHQRELQPALLIGADVIISNSKIDLCATTTGRVILEYLVHKNSDRMLINNEYLSEHQFEKYTDTVDCGPHESSFESLPGAEFYDLYDNKSTDITTENQILNELSYA